MERYGGNVFAKTVIMGSDVTDVIVPCVCSCTC